MPADDQETAETGQRGLPTEVADRQYVAVVAVHGVADQGAGDSARAIADLFARRMEVSFVEERIRIPLVKIEVGTPAPSSPTGLLERAVPSERSRFVQDVMEGREAATADEEVAGHAFVVEQLCGYDPEGPRVLDTMRLEGVAQEGPEIHVHEVWWADLSRPSAGLLQFGLDLYTVMLHLPNLGRTAVDYARVAGIRGTSRQDAIWRTWAFAQAWAVRLLTLPIPMLNLAALSVAVVFAVLKLSDLWTGGTDPWPPGRVELAAMVVPLLVALVFTAVGLLARPPTRWLYATPPLLGATVGLAGFGLAYVTSPELALSVEGLVVALAVLGVLYAQYEKVRPNALAVGVATQVAVLLVFTVMAWETGAVTSREQLHENLAVAAFRTIEVVLIATNLTWLAMLVAGLVAVGCGSVLFLAAEGGEPRKRIGLVSWVSTVSLALPTAAFLVVTLVLWSALYAAVGRFLLPEYWHEPWGACVSEVWTICVGAQVPAARMEDLVQHMIVASGAGQYVTVLALLGVVVGGAGWALFPSAIEEVLPSRRRLLPPRPHTVALGRWLSLGFVIIEVAAFLASLAVLAGVPLLGNRAGDSELDSLVLSTVGAGALLLVAGGARSALGGVRQAFDLVLDIDNYMREHPRSATPRARIAERWISMLRHLRTWRHPVTGKPYTRIVFVAHSQGSVICADLFRLLKRAPQDLPGEHLPMTLMTMGSPLRQLYFRYLPHLYAWLRRTPTVPPKDPGCPIGAPDPEALGLDRWVNLYCSGDYVGRHLWHVEDPDSHDEKVLRADDGSLRIERCLGSGAHTHYWDDTFPLVGDYLRDLAEGQVPGATLRRTIPTGPARRSTPSPGG